MKLERKVSRAFLSRPCLLLGRRGRAEQRREQRGAAEQRGEISALGGNKKRSQRKKLEGERKKNMGRGEEEKERK